MNFIFHFEYIEKGYPRMAWGEKQECQKEKWMKKRALWDINNN